MTVVTEQYRLVKYNEDLDSAWDSLVKNSISGTFLQTRRFLSYHKDKFQDQSLLIYDCDNILRVVFPAAVDPNDRATIVSHPGITYGGLIHDGWLRGQRCIDLLQQLCTYYAEAGFAEIKYKAVPWIYHRRPAQDDIYALFRLGADRYRMDLSATVDLQNRGLVAERRARTLKKAIKAGLQISDDFKYLQAYWSVLAQTLASKYDKTPVHSVAELCLLKERFPEEIELITAIDDKKVQAGSLLFHCPIVSHAQYLASSVEGRDIGALDMVVEDCLQRTGRLGKRFFDFGISTDQQGMFLNENLHTFKSEFGAGASVYEFYKIKIN